mgnify:CR=1 FL=1
MPMRSLPKTTEPNPETFEPHEIDLRGLFAGDYLKIGAHWFIVQRQEAVTQLSRLPRPDRSDDDPVRDWAFLDLKLVHAQWRGCDGH